MLVDEQDCYIRSVMCIIVKCLFDCGGFCLGVDNKEILLRIWWLRDMLKKGVVSFSFARSTSIEMPDAD